MTQTLTKEERQARTRKHQRLGVPISPLGHYIQSRLEAIPMSQRELAERLGVPSTRIHRWLRGIQPPPEMMSAMADVLSVDVAELFQATLGASAPTMSARVAYIAEQLQQLVDEVDEERGAEVLDLIEAQVRLLRGK